MSAAEIVPYSGRAERGDCRSWFGCRPARAHRSIEAMANNSSSRTTELHDRRAYEISLDEYERVRI